MEAWRIILAVAMFVLILCVTLGAQNVYHYQNDDRPRLKKELYYLGARFRSWYNSGYFWIEIGLIIIYLAYVIFVI